MPPRASQWYCMISKGWGGGGSTVSVLVIDRERAGMRVCARVCEGWGGDIESQIG